MTLVSLVIPLYNNASYLRRFVACLQAQTLKDFEALFIDDASTDDGAAILEGCMAGDSRFRLLRNPKNVGAGASRNIGIRAAVGETLCFSDPDDLLPQHSLQVRYEAFKTHRAIVRACHDEVGDDGTLRNHEMRPDGLPLISKPSDVAHLYGVNPFVCAHWTWLFPTKMLKRLNIYNEEGTRTAEDIIFLVHLFFHISRVVWIDETVYYWMKRTDSLSNTFYTIEHYINYFQCVDLFYREAIPNNKVALADLFFNDYLACYLAHLLYQIVQGKSTENDAQIVLGEAIRICKCYGTFERCFEGMKKNAWKNRGFYKLWLAMTESNVPITQRLIDGHKTFAENGH